MRVIGDQDNSSNETVGANVTTTSPARKQPNVAAVNNKNGGGGALKMVTRRSSSRKTTNGDNNNKHSTRVALAGENALDVNLMVCIHICYNVNS